MVWTLYLQSLRKLNRMLDPNYFLIPSLPCEHPSSKALPKTLEQGSKLMKWTLNHAWTLGFRGVEVEAEEDAINLKFKGINMKKKPKTLWAWVAHATTPWQTSKTRVESFMPRHGHVCSMSWHSIFLTNPPFDSSKLFTNLHRKTCITILPYLY